VDITACRASAFGAPFFLALASALNAAPAKAIVKARMMLRSEDEFGKRQDIDIWSGSERKVAIFSHLGKVQPDRLHHP
ncbi:MAG: hypothetical protein EBV73_07975, partial [Rhodocyclales bacterium]|nr:hypothetical protein [Rhodocyclales bacterium]